MNQYILWPEMILFYGAMPKQIAQHQHPVIQLIIAVGGHFLKKDVDGSWLPMQSLLVAPNVSHECDAANQKLFSLSIDPDSVLGEHILQEQLRGADELQYPPEALARIRWPKVSHWLRQQRFDELQQDIYRFFAQDSYQGPPSDQDPRIATIRNYIETHLQDRITTEDLCQMVFLSESRLLHLFKKEMGLPIRNYILWVKIRRAIELMSDDYSLTYIAHEVGFFDSAHMSRTFVRTLGMNPAEIIKNSKFVQVSVAQGI